MKCDLKRGLYIVSTPIGNLSDMTFRAIETLKSSDRILCEDTRVTSKLLSYYSITNKLLPYHDHNESIMIPKILSFLNNGEAISIVSDSGTPLVSDPGFKLVKACYENNIKVIPIPGASSVMAAVSISGMPPYPFTFLGFFNEKKAIEWANIDSTLVIFESSHKICRTLEVTKKILHNRKICVLRELTKIYEERISGSFDCIIDHYNLNKPKGEVIMVLGPPESLSVVPSKERIIEFLEEKSREKLNNKTRKESKEEQKEEKHSTRSVSKIISQKFGISQRDAYKIMLDIKTEKDT